MIRSGFRTATRHPLVRNMTYGKDLPIVRTSDAKRKEVEDILEPKASKVPVAVSAEESAEINGVPPEHSVERRARIFRATREATQAPWNNTTVWRIELDNRSRWENPLIGWCSSGDPLSNVSMHMKFASKEDAIAFCEKNRWSYDVEKEHIRQITPKSYGTNFSWNKRARGRTEEAAKYQQLLHRNLIHLAQAADQSLLSQLRDENPPNDENCAQPIQSEGGPPSGAPTPTAAPYPLQQPQSTTQPMMGPPVIQVQPPTGPVPTSQPQMGLPMGPPQGYGYPPQGMPPVPQSISGPQVISAGYPMQSYEQVMYQQQAVQQQQQYMR
ncbi:ETC complex I subunit region [Dictyocaulus viviparus]|uniref:NADH dehydrogenase [ubiquinone] iron-sulfur protein 4, mitochondrial n=1 Tax=Dictyocaulus viviparus TaxID=29172 RepID=A0A0D8X956_DICVI|nr:ETC complex I subunit region [Dictyocaulus viviparus]